MRWTPRFHASLLERWSENQAEGDSPAVRTAILRPHPRDGERHPTIVQFSQRPNRWNRYHNSALDVRHICLHSFGKSPGWILWDSILGPPDPLSYLFSYSILLFYSPILFSYSILLFYSPILFSYSILLFYSPIWPHCHCVVTSHQPTKFNAI